MVSRFTAIIIYLFVRHKNIVSSRYILHDVTLNAIVFQNCNAVVNQDRGWRGLKI